MIPWTGAHQAPLSLEFSRQEYCGVGCHFLLQGIFPTQEIEPMCPALASGFFTTEPPGEPLVVGIGKYWPKLGTPDSGWDQQKSSVPGSWSSVCFRSSVDLITGPFLFQTAYLGMYASLLRSRAGTVVMVIFFLWYAWAFLWEHNLAGHIKSCHQQSWASELLINGCEIKVYLQNQNGSRDSFTVNFILERLHLTEHCPRMIFSGLCV